MTITFATKSAWQAVYIHGTHRVNGHQVNGLRASLGVDPWLGASDDGKGARVFGSFGRWRFAFHVPCIRWMLARKHWAFMMLYKWDRAIRHRIDGRYGLRRS